MTKKLVYVKSSNCSVLTTLIDVLREPLDAITIHFIKDKDSNRRHKKNLKNKENGSESENSESDDEETKKDKKSLKTEDDSEESDNEETEKPKKNKKNSKKNADESDDEEPKKEEKKISKNEGGIKILELDEQQTVIIYVKLLASEFADFYVKKKIMKVGLELGDLHRFFKTVDKESVLTISIDKEDEQNIIFQKKTNNRNKIGTYKQKLMEPDDQDIALPKQNKFKLWVEMETEEFHKMIKHMSDIAEYIEIICTANDITFQTQGSTSFLQEKYVNITNGSKEKGVKITLEPPNKKTTIVQAIYEIKHFKLFSKCHQLSESMIFGFKNDYPLFIQYAIGENSRMVVGLSPVDSDTIKKDNDYNEEMDKSYNPHKKIVMKKTD